jgi:hypothetical protein
VTTSKKRGLGADIFFQTDRAIKRGSGRKKVYPEPRVKVSFWVRQDTWHALEIAKNEERAQKEKAGAKDWRLVSVSSLAQIALDDFLKRRK